MTSLTRSCGSLLYAATTAEAVQFDATWRSTSAKRWDAALRDYADRFRRPGVTGYDDVGIAALHRAPAGVAVLDTNIFDLDFLSQRPEVRFGRERCGFFRRFYLNTAPDPLIRSGLIVYYDNGFDHVPPQDMARVSPVAPHLVKALDMTRWTQALRRRHGLVLSVLDRIEIGFAVVQPDGGVILTNRCAEDLLRDSEGLDRERRGALVGRRDDVTARLSAILRGVGRTAQGGDGAPTGELAVPRSANRPPLLVIVSPLRDAARELERDLAGCLVAIIDPERSPALRLGAFAAAYGLTEAEARVAGLLVRGLSGPEIAERLDVAPSTAKTQIKAVYEKTGASNRAAFVWTAVQFSPPIT